MHETLKEKLQEDMKSALRARDQKRLGTIRLMLAAIKQKEIDGQISLDDNAVLVVFEKMVKQRRDAKQQYEKAGRTDLSDQEAFEIQIIESYMPAKLDEAELLAIIKQAIMTTGAKEPKDIGKVMAEVKPQVQGKADMQMVSAKIKELL